MRGQFNETAYYGVNAREPSNLEDPFVIGGPDDEGRQAPFLGSNGNIVYPENMDRCIEDPNDNWQL